MRGTKCTCTRARNAQAHIKHTRCMREYVSSRAPNRMAHQAQKVCACTQSPQSMLVTHQAHVEVIVSHTTSIRNAQCAHQVYKGHTCTPSALSLCAHRVHKVGMHTRRTAMHYARAGLPTSNAQSGRVHTKSQCWARAHQAHDARRHIEP